MKQKMIGVVIGFTIIAFSTTLVAGGGGKARRPSAPSYYTEDDLESITRTYCSGVWYDNYSYSENDDVAYMPVGIVDSGSNVAGVWKKNNSAKIAATYSGYIKRNGSTKSSPTTRIAWWGTPLIAIDWDRMGAQNGDIIFIRSDALTGRAVHLISSWTHTGMIYNKGGHEVLDSMKEGVDIRNTDREWGKVLAYGTKGVKRLNKDQRFAAVNAAKAKYQTIPYLPQWNKNANSKMSFLQRWSRKDCLDSIYCSKLVWLAFYDYAGIDLDSNRTKWNYLDLQERNNSCWVGVSPDDIWGSDETTAAFDLVRVDGLTTPTSGI